MRTLENVKGKRFVFLDLVVGALAVFLVLFLLVTMGIRSYEIRLEDECKARLLALAAAEQFYLSKHKNYTSDLELLRPFLEEERQRMPMVCPLNGETLQARTQGDRYKIIAPGTAYYVETGDPSW